MIGFTQWETIQGGDSEGNRQNIPVHSDNGVTAFYKVDIGFTHSLGGAKKQGVVPSFFWTATRLL